MKPTDKQKQEFWEQCGLTLKYSNWEMPDGKGYASLDDIVVDLNNLFKYAVPKFDIVTLQITNGAKTKAVAIRKEGIGEVFMDDPAVALFWACFSALGGNK